MVKCNLCNLKKSHIENLEELIIELRNKVLLTKNE